MFNNTKYTKIYHSIISNAQQRDLNGYTEKHHIIPSSLGGSDDVTNLVKLTAREHFICHWLLTKMLDDTYSKWKMINALGLMLWIENDNQQRYKVNSRLYEQLKKKHSEYRSWAVSGERNGFYGKTHTEEAKEAIRQKNTGSTLTEEQKEKVRLAKLGKKRKPFTQEHIDKIRVASTGENNPMYGKKHSEETLKKISEKAKARIQSEETKIKISKSRSGKNHSPKTIAKMQAAWERRRQKAKELGVSSNLFK